MPKSLIRRLRLGLSGADGDSMTEPAPSGYLPCILRSMPCGRRCSLDCVIRRWGS